MSLDFYWFPVSQPSRAVSILLNTEGVEHNAHVIDLMKGQQKSEEYKAVNPKSKVPAIKDGDFVLTEGAAILQYIAENKGAAEHWYPRDGQKRARVNEWLHWSHTTIRKTSTYEILVPVLFAKTTPTEAAIQAHESHLAVLDEQLGKTKFLVGDEPTIADLFIVTEVDQLGFFGLFDNAKFTNVVRWLNDLTSGVKGYASDVENLKNIIAAMNKKE